MILQSIVDITRRASYSSLRTTAQETTGDWRGYKTRNASTSLSYPVGAAPTQDLGRALFMEGDIEGFVTMSARVPFQSSLVVYPERLKPGSELVFFDPDTKAKARLAG